MKQPKIRFKRFSGEWEEKNIASIANLKAGKSINTSQEISYPSNGYYPCYGGNGLRGFVRDYTHDGIYNIIGRQGALCGNVKLVSGKFHATEHAVVVSPTTPLDPYFLYNLLTKANINQYATGVAQPGISVQNVNKSLFLVLPNFAEQRTVGMYFQHLDSLIQSTAKKIDSLKQVKAASLQSMFPQEGETTPRVRFKGFEGEWEKTAFYKSVIVNSGKDYKHLSEGSIPVYGTGGYMLSVNESLSDIDAIGIGRKGTIDKPQLLKAPFWTVDTLFFMTPQKDFDLFFLYAVCEQIDWRKYDESTGVPSLSKLTIGNIEFSIPQKEEQQTIGAFFKHLDSQISLHSQRLEKLKQIKSACLDNMFV